MAGSVERLGSLLASSLWFVIVLFFKLCYSTALFATLAEVTRRIEVFRRSRRPTARALLLLPVVILFCSAILFALNLWPLFVSGFSLSASFLLTAFLRLFLFALALAIGAALGLFLGSRVGMGHDRFGGVLYDNPGRYLGLWLGAFGVCGFFRLLPWGFLSFASVLVLVLVAAAATAAHWLLYSRYRSLVSAPLALPQVPGPVRLALSAREAVALALLTRHPEGLTEDGARQALSQPDASLAAHPAWNAEAAALTSGGPALPSLLDAMAAKGLALSDAAGWRAAGAAARLAELGHVTEAVALTVKTAGAARTLVCQRRGELTLLIEPGPTTLRIEEQAPGTPSSEALGRGLGVA